MATAQRNASDGTTHVVVNQPPPLLDYNAFDADVALIEALERDGGGWGLERVRDLIGAADLALMAAKAGSSAPR